MHATGIVHGRFGLDSLFHAIGPYRLDGVLEVAELLMQQVQLAAAEQVYKRALVEYDKALGLDQMSTLSVVYNLDSLYRAQDKLEKAEQV